MGEEIDQWDSIDKVVEIEHIEGVYASVWWEEMARAGGHLRGWQVYEGQDCQCSEP
jgi:hypothetical protein